MRIGVVSDTHDDAPLCRIAAAWLDAQGLDLVLHLGDVTTLATLRAFDKLPLVALRGNNDAAIPGLSNAWEHVVEDVRVGATHGHLRGEMARLLGSCDVLLHGHSHARREERVGRCLVMNPGALHRAPVKTLALLELPSARVAFHEVTPERVVPLG